MINNVSPQGDNVEMKLNLKWKKFAEIVVLSFCEMNNNAPGF